MEIVTFFYPNILRIWDNPGFAYDVNLQGGETAEFPMSKGLSGIWIFLNFLLRHRGISPESGDSGE